MKTKKARGAPRPWEWFTRLPRIGRMAIAAVLGAVAALGQAPFNQPLAMLLAISLAFLMLRRQPRALDAAAAGWAFGAGYFALSLFWIIEPFQIDPEKHGWMAPFALVFLSMGLALFWGGAFWTARLLSPRAWPLILTWTAAEILRAYLFTGFPWATPAQALVDGLAGRSLAWVGPHGATLWLMSVAWALSFPAIYRRRTVMRVGQGALLLSTAALFFLRPSSPPSPLTPHWVRLVQPNAAQHLKWLPEMANVFYQRQLEFSAAPPVDGQPSPALIVWPETAIPWALADAQPVFDGIAASVRGTPTVLGVLRREDNVLFNSMAVLDGQGALEQLYDKHHLVPFGEYVPFGNFAARLGIRGLANSDGVGFARGPGATLLDFGALGQGLPLICYEAVFAHGMRTTSARPDFLLQITNDAWFGQNAGPQQHLAQARMRAIEQGLPMMRAANTGISAMIDPKGRVIAQLPLGEAGFIDAPLPRPARATLYSRTGDLPIVAILALSLLLAALKSRRNSADQRRRANSN